MISKHREGNTQKTQIVETYIENFLQKLMFFSTFQFDCVLTDSLHNNVNSVPIAQGKKQIFFKLRSGYTYKKIIFLKSQKGETRVCLIFV